MTCERVPVEVRLFQDDGPVYVLIKQGDRSLRLTRMEAIDLRYRLTDALWQLEELPPFRPVEVETP